MKQKKPVKRKQNYFIYDGRANYDIESASVVECFESKSDSAARYYHEKEYKGHDTVLCDSHDNIIY